MAEHESSNLLNLCAEGCRCDGYGFKQGWCFDHGRGWDPEACWRDHVIESGARYETR